MDEISKAEKKMGQESLSSPYLFQLSWVLFVKQTCKIFKVR